MKTAKEDCCHAPCQYSADACSGCPHDMDCYQNWLAYMAGNGKKE